MNIKIPKASSMNPYWYDHNPSLTLFYKNIILLEKTYQLFIDDVLFSLRYNVSEYKCDNEILLEKFKKSDAEDTLIMGYTNKTINYSDNILGVYFDSDGIISSYATKNKHAELSFNQVCGLYTYHQSIHSKLTANTQNDECDKDDDHYVNETYVKESVNENLPLIETDPIKSPEIKFTKLTLDDINIFKNNGVAFITEDFASFDTEEEAAEIIITRNGGHALAHEIYNLFVKYPNNKRPYEHFRHVLENNNGIKNQNKVDTYEFEDGNHLGKFRDQLLNKAFKKDDIIKISKSLVEINNCTNMINEILNHN